MTVKEALYHLHIEDKVVLYIISKNCTESYNTISDALRNSKQLDKQMTSIATQIMRFIINCE